MDVCEEVMMTVATNATDALKVLWHDKVFLKPKNLNDIESILEKKGYNFTKSALAMALSRSKFLTRKGKQKDYSYVQKHPYIEVTKNESKRRTSKKNKKS